MQVVLFFIVLCCCLTSVHAQTPSAVPLGKNAVYGNAPVGDEAPRFSANPGWNSSLSAGSDDIVRYLERAAGNPVARKPDPGRVTAFNVHDVYEVEPAVAVAQHPLEGFGYMRPVPVSRTYSELPFNRQKFAAQPGARERELDAVLWSRQ